jgi:hypothetical protein
VKRPVFVLSLDFKLLLATENACCRDGCEDVFSAAGASICTVPSGKVLPGAAMVRQRSPRWQLTGTVTLSPRTRKAAATD